MDNKNIGEKIRVLRKSRNITINDLGRLVGMSKSTISMWETGQRRPEYEELEKLATVFGKSISYFFEDPEQNVVTIVGRNGTYKKFILSEKDLKAIQNLAESLSDANELAVNTNEFLKAEK